MNNKTIEAAKHDTAAAAPSAAGQSGPAAGGKQSTKSPKRFEIKKKGDLPRHAELIADNDEGTIAFTDDPILANALQNSGFEVIDTQQQKKAPAK
jgi:hypothetical protein